MFQILRSVEFTDDSPSIFGRVAKSEKIEVIGGYKATLGEIIPVDKSVPMSGPEENDGHGFDFFGLNESKYLKEFIESTKTTGENTDRLSA